MQIGPPRFKELEYGNPGLTEFSILRLKQTIKTATEDGTSQ